MLGRAQCRGRFPTHLPESGGDRVGSFTWDSLEQERPFQQLSSSESLQRADKDRGPEASPAPPAHLLSVTPTKRCSAPLSHLLPAATGIRPRCILPTRSIFVFMRLDRPLPAGGSAEEPSSDQGAHLSNRPPPPTSRHLYPELDT